MSKNNVLTVTGEVIEALPNAMFRVKVNELQQEILSYLSGKMRRHMIRLIEGDRIQVELSPYDLTRGRITRRL